MNTKSFLLFLIFNLQTIFLFSQNNNSFKLENFYESERLLFSVVKIEVYSQNKSKIDTSIGTGFIFSFKLVSNNYLPVIVTNKHVIKGSSSFSVSFTKKSRLNTPLYGQFDKYEFNNNSIRWFYHPKEGVDLAVTPLIPILNELPDGKQGYVYYSIIEEYIPNDYELQNLKGVEDLLMIGYPIGIWDNKNNMPITRRGITATLPRIDYQGRSEFVIDAACFPGSSGSPILIVNEGFYSSKNGIKVGERILFMGILYGGPQYYPNNEIKIIEIPTRKDAVTVFQVPLNLGYVIKSKNILDFKSILGIE